MLVRYEARHPSLAASRLVIAQVPGSMPRSSNPKGVVESFLKSKKYIVPSAIASPIFAGCVVAVYVGTGAGRFQPDQDALVFNPGSNPEPPIARKDRKAYEREFKQLLAETDPAAKQQGPEKAWEHLQSKARTGFDDQQAPVLQMHVGEQQVSLGVSAGNIFNGTAPPQLVQQIIEARLQSELHHAPPKGLSQQAITRDWTLLQQTMSRQARTSQSQSDRNIHRERTLSGLPVAGDHIHTGQPIHAGCPILRARCEGGVLPRTAPWAFRSTPPQSNKLS